MAAVTVKLAEQVFGASQLLVAVNVTVVAPPQAEGAPPLLLLMLTLQPPIELTEFNQLLNFVLMAVCVWHAASVTLTGQMSVKRGAPLTANTAEQVLFGSQVEVTVQVTVFEPPQADGAEPPLLEIAAPQPPEKFALDSHVA